MYHVQYFGEKVSHCWVLENHIFPFKRGGVEELMKEQSFLKHVNYLESYIHIFKSFTCITLNFLFTDLKQEQDFYISTNCNQKKEKKLDRSFGTGGRKLEER